MHESTNEHSIYDADSPASPAAKEEWRKAVKLHLIIRLTNWRDENEFIKL